MVVSRTKTMNMTASHAETILLYSTLLLYLLHSNKIHTADAMATVPPGCTCMGPNQEASACTQFDCLCPCDITDNMCDLDCCCDTDCTEQEVSDFDCIENKNQLKSKLPLCAEIDNKSLSTPGPTHLGAFVENVMNLLCVEVDNSATKGTFFEGQETIDLPISEVTINELKREDFSSGNEQMIVKSNRTGLYHTGDYLQSVERQGTAGYREITEFVIPNQNDGGLCETNSVVRFGSEIRTSCTRLISDMETDCTKVLNIDSYINKTSILNSKTSRSSLNYDSSATSLVDIELATTTDINGTSIPILLGTKYSPDSKTCQRAVKSVHYSVSISSSGEITSVTADVDVTDVSHGTRSIPQDFVVSFGTGSSSKEQSNSGNPGYIFGMPVLAGKEEDNDVVTEGHLKTFSVGGGGDCLPVSISRSVAFGEDLIVGCSIPLTKDELENLCTANDHPYLTHELYIPKWLGQDMNLVGEFGNANPNDRSQWLAIDNPIKSNDFNIKSRKWSPEQSMCDGLISSLKYLILWTYVGSVENPQAKIISLTQEYDDSHHMQHKLDPDEIQKYHFTAIVSWVFIPSETETVKLPPPNLFFSVPDDIFYPFNDKSSGEKTDGVCKYIKIAAICFVFILSIII